MSLYFMVVLAIGLSMDTLAVTIALGAAIESISAFAVVRIAGCLAIVSTSLACLGWAMAGFVDFNRTPCLGWIGSVMLVTIGLHTLFGSATEQPNSRYSAGTLGTSLGIGMATGIDAYVAGATIAGNGSNVVLFLIILCTTTVVMVTSGCVVGYFARERVGNQTEVFGGMILVSLGGSGAFI